jgi:hypothetical protein
LQFELRTLMWKAADALSLRGRAVEPSHPPSTSPRGVPLRSTLCTSADSTTRLAPLAPAGSASRLAFQLCSRVSMYAE